MAGLQTACAERRHYLEESQRLHEYLRESNELEQWIGEQMVLACSDEFGRDYEHVQVGSHIYVLYLFILMGVRLVSVVYCISSSHKSWDI